MSEGEFKADYKGRAIITGVSHSGSNGPYRGNFSVSSKHSDAWKMDHEEFIEQDYSSEIEARAAANEVARRWIDEQQNI